MIGYQDIIDAHEAIPLLAGDVDAATDRFDAFAVGLDLDWEAANKFSIEVVLPTAIQAIVIGVETHDHLEVRESFEAGLASCWTLGLLIGLLLAKEAS